MIGGSFSYGDRLLVFLNISRSDDFKKKSFMARIGVIKLRSILVFNALIFEIVPVNKRTCLLSYLM